MDDPTHGLPPVPRRGSDFSAAYEDGTPPWDIGRPQPAFAALSRAGRIRGRVLDAGCGTGEHALMAAVLDLDATGIDAAARAIEIAKRKARERNVEVRFLVGDLLELPALGEQFDAVLDCGVFHVFDDDDRRDYVDALAASMPAGGLLHLLCFSDAEPGDWGPRRVTRAELEATFADGWQIESIEPASMVLIGERDHVAGWLAAIRRA